MDKRRIWGWWFFDWASQPYATLLTTFIFPVYFSEVARQHFVGQGLTPEAAAAQTQTLWGYGLAISGAVIALLAPLLGAIADSSGRRIVWIYLFSALYVAGAWGLWFLTPQAPQLYLAVFCFGIGLIGSEFATIFTNALLPGLAPREETGRVSGSGMAFGYLGGVIALALTGGADVESLLAQSAGCAHRGDRGRRRQRQRRRRQRQRRGHRPAAPRRVVCPSRPSPAAPLGFWAAAVVGSSSP